jgi:NADH:ubiquinone oxidoreductase subunit 6 (subunit J)
MTELIAIAVVLAFVCAAVAVVLGEVLTRSIVAASAAVAAFGLAGLAAGGSVVALCVVIVGLLALAILQLFGWMLVDVDHDHLPRLSLRTASARALSLAVVAAGLAQLGREALGRRELEPTPLVAGYDPAIDPAALGAVFFGSSGVLAVVLGCLLAAALLTALCLLREEGTDAG